MDFHNFSCKTSQENAKVIGIKTFCHTFVMLPPYHVKVSDTKVTHFTPILALCTCLHRSHLQKPVSMKESTAESQRLKIYVHNVHHSREHMHSNDCATAQSLMVSVAVSSLGATQLHFLEPGVSTVTITGIQFCWICFCRISALFSGITTFFSKMGHRHIVHMTLSPCCRERETPEFIPPQMTWPPNSPDLNPVD